MTGSSESTIAKYEERLRAAMLTSDVAALDELLAEDLVFINHLGSVMGKEDDLSAHRTGAVTVSSIAPSDERIRLVGGVAIVSVRVAIAGSLGGVTAEATLRFTRVWAPTKNGAWQVVAAHSTPVADAVPEAGARDPTRRGTA